MLPIIGMSPWNSYFKEREVAFLLRETMRRYGQAVIMVADVPAIKTYLAMWYQLPKARSKAKLKWNNLKNRVKRVISELWFDAEQVVIVDRSSEVESNDIYQEKLSFVNDMYNNNQAFATSVFETSQDVLEASWKPYDDVSTELATHYLLSEIAFLEYAPAFLNTEKVAYVYHKNRRIYEDYIAWIFDETPKPHLDFVLLEATHETYIWGKNRADSRYAYIQETWKLRCAYSPYYELFDAIPNAESIDAETDDQAYTWVIYDLLVDICSSQKLIFDIQWQMWYGVLSERIHSGYVDMFCSPVRPTKSRRLEMFFSKSLFTSDIYGYMSASSPYAQYTLEQLQQHTWLRIAVKENDIHHEIAKEFFPDARLVRVPQLSHIDEVLTFVLDNRADLTFWAVWLVQTYMREHALWEHTIVQKWWNDDAPVKIYDNCLALPRGEFELKRMIDEGIDTYWTARRTWAN